jgi:glutaredoxin-related protein
MTQLNEMASRTSTAPQWVGSADLNQRAAVDVRLYTSSASGIAKTNSDTRRLLHLLNAHSITYRLIDLADDTSSTPGDRLAMLTASNCVDTLPQLHVNGRFIGTAENVQEMEDFGELSKVLAGIDLDAVVEATRVAIEQRLLEDREWRERRTVARKSGIGACDTSTDTRTELDIQASSATGDKNMTARRDSKHDVTDLEFV